MLEELFERLFEFGYLGIFLITFIGNATIIFPLPAAGIVFAAGAFLNPLFVGLIAGFGASLGEFVGYGLGYGGGKLGERKYDDRYKKKIERTKKLFDKYGGFWVLLVFAASPLPDDIAGIAGGILKYEIKKFFIAILIGKIIFNLFLAYGGYYGANWVLEYAIF